MAPDNGTDPRRIAAATAAERARDQGLTWLNEHTLFELDDQYRTTLPQVFFKNCRYEHGAGIDVYADVEEGILVLDFEGETYER